MKSRYTSLLLVLLSVALAGCTTIPQASAQASIKPINYETTKNYTFEVLPNLNQKDSVKLECGFNWVEIRSERKLSVEVEVRDSDKYLVISASQAKVKLGELNSPVTWELNYLGTEKLYIPDSGFYIRLAWKDLDKVVWVESNICE